MERLKNIRVELLAVSIIIVSAVVLSVLQTLLYYVQTPAGSYYPFVHNFISDYYYYLHIMRQGFDGMWVATSRLTPEIYPGQFIVVWFLLLGHLAKIFHLSLPFAYTLARLLGGVLLLFLSYKIAIELFPKNSTLRILSLFFVAFSTPFFIWTSRGPDILPFVRMWTEADPLVRLTYIPHHLWSKVFLLISFLELIWLYKTPRIHTLIFLLLSVVLMGFSSPVTLLTYLITLALWILFEFINKTKNVSFYFAFCISMAYAILISLFHRHIEQSVFPWTSYISWEGHVQYSFTKIHYLGTFGPIIFFFPVAVCVLWKKSSIARLLTAWALSGIVGLFFSKLLPITNIRFTEGYQYIPIALLSVFGINEIAKLFQNTLKIRHMLFCIVGLLSIYFAMGITISWRQQADYIKESSWNPQVYVPVPIMEAFSFLDKNTASDSVVLAPLWISTMIPAFSSNRTVAGHPLMTQDAKSKEHDIDQFYAYSDTSTMKDILRKYSISYIVEEKALPIPEATRNIFGLVPVYENLFIRIYQ